MIRLSIYSEFDGIISSALDNRQRSLRNTIQAINKIAGVCLALLVVSSTHAQEEPLKFELAPIVGFATGGDFKDTTGSASLDLDDSSSFGLIFDIRESPNTQWEVLYSLQATEANTAGLAIPGPPLDIDVHYVQGGGTYLFEGNSARPFVAVTLGASHFEPGRSGVGSETFFGFSIGTGLRIRLNERFGIRLEARAYGTLLDSDSDLFCQSDPAGALCAVRVEGEVLWQFHATAGFVFGF